VVGFYVLNGDSETNPFIYYKTTQKPNVTLGPFGDKDWVPFGVVLNSDGSATVGTRESSGATFRVIPTDIGQKIPDANFYVQTNSFPLFVYWPAIKSPILLYNYLDVWSFSFTEGDNSPTVSFYGISSTFQYFDGKISESGELVIVGQDNGFPVLYRLNLTAAFSSPAGSYVENNVYQKPTDQNFNFVGSLEAIDISPDGS